MNTKQKTASLVLTSRRLLNHTSAKHARKGGIGSARRRGKKKDRATLNSSEKGEDSSLEKVGVGPAKARNIFLSILSAIEAL